MNQLPQATAFEMPAMSIPTEAEQRAAKKARDQKQGFSRSGAKQDPTPCATAVASSQLIERRVIQLAKQGKIQADIAKATGIDSKKVRRLLEHAGVVAESRPPGKDRTEAVRILFERGMSQRSIAAVLRIDRNAVGNLIKRMGWKR